MDNLKDNKGTYFIKFDRDALTRENHDARWARLWQEFLDRVKEIVLESGTILKRYSTSLEFRTLLVEVEMTEKQAEGLRHALVALCVRHGVSGEYFFISPPLWWSALDTPH